MYKKMPRVSFNDQVECLGSSVRPPTVPFGLDLMRERFEEKRHHAAFVIQCYWWTYQMRSNKSGIIQPMKCGKS